MCREFPWMTPEYYDAMSVGLRDEIEGLLRAEAYEKARAAQR